MQQYKERGYITVSGILSDTDVTTALQSLTDLCTDKNEKFSSAVKASYGAAAVDKLDFKDGQHHAFVQYEKGTEVEMAVGDDKGTDSTALQPTTEAKVRKLMGFCAYEPILNDIAAHPVLHSLLKKLMRIPESAELELFQDMALLKGVGGREKPYHQDHAYFNMQLNAKVIGVWIALDEATEENGCMRCLPGLHRRSAAECIIGEDADANKIISALHVPNNNTKSTCADKSATEYAFTDVNDEFPLWHYMRRDFQICDDLIYRLSDHVTSCPLPKGGMMIFDSKLPHGTPTNKSVLRRRALQFHYVVKGVPRVEERLRLQTFGGEGSGVEC